MDQISECEGPSSCNNELYVIFGKKKQWTICVFWLFIWVCSAFFWIHFRDVGMFKGICSCIMFDEVQFIGCEVS